jgi:ferric-dicitrate binding protein FerR (iron transport regulator)
VDQEDRHGDLPDVRLVLPGIPEGIVVACDCVEGLEEALVRWEVRRGADLSRELAWTEGKLAFRDAPFEEVVRRLRRWYDLRIETELVSEAVGRLNATVDGKSPEHTLRAIAAALDLKYERDGQTVTYYRGEQ